MGRSLEERFLEMVGSIDEMHQQLTWLDSSEPADRRPRR